MPQPVHIILNQNFQIPKVDPPPNPMNCVKPTQEASVVGGEQDVDSDPESVKTCWGVGAGPGDSDPSNAGPGS